MAGFGFGFGFSPLGALLNQIPEAPTGLAAVVVSDSVIDLTWNVNDTIQDGHRIYISTDNVNFTEKGTVSGLTATYSATSLSDGTIYYFKVVSYKGIKESDPTSTVDACTIPSKFLAASVKFWYDYTDAALKTVAGGRVSQVNDKGANGYHQTQGTEGLKPYDLGSSGIQGQGGQRIGNTTALGVNGNVTYLLVGRFDTFENSKVFMQAAISTNSTTRTINSGGYNPQSITAPPDGDWFIFVNVCNNSGTDSLRINNDTPVTWTNNSNLGGINSFFGNTNDTGYIKGSVKSAILINEVLSEGDITKAKTYLNWKYQVFF